MTTWLEQQRYMIDYAVASLWRRKGKMALLWLVYATLVFTLASIMLFGAAIRHEAGVVLGEAPDLVVQAMRMGRHDFTTEDDLARLKGLRGADQLEGRLWGYLYDTSTAANYVIQVPSARAQDYMLARGETIIGEGVARLRKAAAGKPLFLVSPEGKLFRANVKRIITPASALVSSDLVLMHEADFRAFFGLAPGLYTDIAMRVRNPAEVGMVAQKGAVLLPGHRFLSKAAMSRSYETLFSWREGLFLAILLFAMLAFVILAFDRASGLSAEEKREIGILKAVGWDTRHILRMKLWEGALIATSATLVGFLAAYIHVFALSAPLLEPVLKGWSTLYPRFTLTPAIDLFQLATLTLLTTVPYVAAIIVPVWRIASADPDQVMR